MKNLTLRRKDGTVLSATIDDAVCELLLWLLDQVQPKMRPHRMIDSTASLYINLGNKEEPDRVP